MRSTVQVLTSIADVFEDASDLPRALDNALELLVQTVSAERGFILLFEGQGHTSVRHARNFAEDGFESESFRMSFGVLERVVRTGVPFRATNASEHPELRQFPSVAALGIHSILAVPIQIRGKLAGLVYVDLRSKERAFSAEDEALLLEVARYLSGPISASLAIKEQALRLESLQTSLAEGLRDLQARYRYPQLVGRSPSMVRVFETLDRIIGLPYPVLIQGETGTGKELVAKIVHYNGPRKDHPFIAVNCAAVHRDLLESELFGHVKGAFTGATSDRPGLFRAADGGTLFLDEVGETPDELQKKLLRVLQTREYTPVGSRETLKSDVRVIAATNANLDELVKSHRFRDDLLYRLRVLRVELPPLRDRVEDIPLLAERFLSDARKETGLDVASISPSGLQALVRYPWPGNVRELENAIRFAISFGGKSIEPDSLPPEVQSPPLLPVDSRLLEGLPQGAAAEAVDGLWKLLIEKTLARVGGNCTKAARELGISRATFYRRMRELGMEPARDP